MPQLKVHIKSGEEVDDKQEVDSLTRNLRDDLSQLDVVEVPLLYEKPPHGSRALDGVALGSMLISVVVPEVIKQVSQLIQNWRARNDSRSITLEMDGDKIEVKGTSAKDQQKLIDAWIMRKMQKMSVKNE